MKVDLLRLKQTHYRGIQVTDDGVPVGKLYLAFQESVFLGAFELHDLLTGKIIPVNCVIICDEEGRSQGCMVREVLEKVGEREICP